MKKMFLFLPLFLVGCTSFFGKVQTANEVLAAKYGVPKETVQTIRQALGVPDARTLPGPERVLPEGLMLTYDMLDASNNVVDVSGFHRSEFPRIVPAGTKQPSVFDTSYGKGSEFDLESFLKLLKSSKINSVVP